jgi:hypothetical protein
MNRKILMILALVAVTVLGRQPAWSQATISTGSIQGSVTDPQGGAIAGAKVTIAFANAGKSLELETNSAGLYNSGALTPGAYTVRVVAQGFKTTAMAVTVQVGSVATGNVQLELGSASTVVEVSAGTIEVNTEQAQVQGVVTQEQIENLPINGRNFLDLAQLEPGVQIQDGGDFDPTKTGFSSISFGGRYGRTARIEVDGVDVSDETVGTTTESIPESAISEFQIAQSSLDLSNELTSSGAVNVVTKSGTNSFHGGGYGAFRDSTQGALLPGAGTYQRNQEGGDIGGAIIKDKLFFFADGERTLQHAGAGVAPAGNFAKFAGNFPSPFKEGDLLGRVDFQATKSLHLFYRYGYFSNYLVPAFGPPSFSFFANKDITRNHVLGADWTNGPWTHSVRFEYLKFQNAITDAVRGSGEPFADFPVAMQFLVSNLATGPSPDAPQATPQSDHQFKYDGSRILGSHIFRYGFAYNRIHGGGFASFFAFAPLVLSFEIPGFSLDPTANNCGAAAANDPTCPTNYIPDLAIIGNGQGYNSEKPAFGAPFGGTGPDNRVAFYVGDSWKVKSNVTLTYGVRYVRDTGRTDSDLATIPEVNLVLPGLGNRVHQPNANFGPQIGIAWDPWKSGKTVIRAGAGIYYENAIFNNVFFDRGPRLRTGTFFFADSQQVCSFGSAGPVQFGDGSVQFLPGGAATCNTAMGSPIPASAVGSTCGASITVAQCIANFQTAYSASYAANPLGPNPNFIGTEITNGLPLSSIIAPPYLSPRSIQMNVGFQRELSKGTVLSVDYIRNVGTHFLLGIDANHTGDAAFLNADAASAAIDATNASFECGPGQAGVNCAIENGATITDYANNGLDSPKDLATGACNGPNGIGAPCAFAGINPAIGPTSFLFPTGRSLYNAFDVKLTQNKRNPLPGIRYLNGQVSYTLSRFKYSGSSNGLQSPGTPGNQDQDFIDNALDNRSTGRFMGPTLLDRTNQFNFGGFADLPGGFRLGVTGHVWSPLAITPLLNLSAGPGVIFQSDFTGDGTVNDPLPIAQSNSSCGTVGGSCDYTTYKSGAFGRSLSPAGLTKAVNNYNSTIAGQTITPAGQALVNANLMTEAQLIALGATPQTITYTDPATGNQIPGVIPGQVGPGWMKTMDFQISWVKKIGEQFTITPSVGFFNLFNFRNWDASGNTMSGALSGSPGSISGTVGDFFKNPATGNRSNAIGTGTGVFSLGAPRAIEWQVKFSF